MFQDYYQQIEKKFTKGLCEVIVFDKINDSTTVHEIVSELIRGKHVKNTMQNSSLEKKKMTVQHVFDVFLIKLKEFTDPLLLKEVLVGNCTIGTPQAIEDNNSNINEKRSESSFHYKYKILIESIINTNNTSLKWESNEIECKLMELQEGKVSYDIRVAYHIVDNSENIIVSLWVPAFLPENVSSICIKQISSAGCQSFLLIKAHKPNLLESVRSLVDSSHAGAGAGGNSIPIPNKSDLLFSTCKSGEFVVRIPVKQELLIQERCITVENGEIIISIPKIYH